MALPQPDYRLPQVKPTGHLADPLQRLLRQLATQAVTSDWTASVAAVVARVEALEAAGTTGVYGTTGIETFGTGEIRLRTLADSGTGALLGITRDAYGRVSGTRAVTTTDLPEGANLYFTDTRARAAVVVDSIADADVDHAPSRNAVFDALALKAPLASPALTGTPTVPTAAPGTNTTQVASTAFVTAAVAAVPGGTVPTGTGFRHVTAGAEDAASVSIDGQSAASGGDVKLIAPATHAATSKATPVAADELPLVDSAASNVLKRLTWANLVATLTTAFNALYRSVSTAIGTTDLAADAVTYAKMQNVSAASKLLGRGSASGSGDPEEITLGSGLTMTGTTLSASGGGSSATGAIIGGAYVQSTTLRSVSGSNFPFDNTIPQNTEGVALSDYDLSYTPQNASSILEIELTLSWISANTPLQLTLGCFQDAIANALFATDHQLDSGGQNHQYTVRFRVAAGSTSLRTYKWRWGSSTGTAYLNQGNGTAFFGGAILSTHTVKELAP